MLFIINTDIALGSLVCDVFLCLVIFPYGVPDQVGFLIVSTPSLCLLPYFYLFYLVVHHLKFIGFQIHFMECLYKGVQQ